MSKEFRPLSELLEHGLRTQPGFDTRGRHLKIRFEPPVQLNNAPT